MQKQVRTQSLIHVGGGHAAANPTASRTDSSEKVHPGFSREP